MEEAPPTTPSAAVRRLAEIERQVARICPPPATDERWSWLAWTSADELDELAVIARRAAELRLDAIPPEGQRRMLAIEATALARMFAGEPN